MANTFRNKTVEDDLDDPRLSTGRMEAEPAAADEAKQGGGERERKSKSRRSQRRRAMFIIPKVSPKWALRQTGVILLSGVYLMLVVSNRYRVERLYKEKIQLERNIEFLREQRIQMQRDYQESIKISRIADMLDTVGVGLISGPPFELKREDE